MVFGKRSVKHILVSYRTQCRSLTGANCPGPEGVVGNRRPHVMHNTITRTTVVHSARRLNPGPALGTAGMPLHSG